MPIQILDIYHGNAFDAVKESNTGTDAVLIKAGQGQYQDYEASNCTYIHDADCAQLPWGVFWQMDARYSPQSHKAAIKAFFDRHGFGTMGLFLACEKPFYPLPDFLYGKMPFAFYKPIESVWRGLHDYTGSWPGIYTSPGMWQLIFGQCPPALQQEFAAICKLWAAQYGVKAPDPIGQWLSWWFWQYQEGPDFSVFVGSDEQFQSLYGKLNPAPAPEIPPAPPCPAAGRVAILQEAIDAIERLK